MCNIEDISYNNYWLMHILTNIPGIVCHQCMLRSFYCKVRKYYWLEHDRIILRKLCMLDSWSFNIISMGFNMEYRMRYILQMQNISYKLYILNSLMYNYCSLYQRISDMNTVHLLHS